MRLLRYLDAEDLALGLTGNMVEAGCTLSLSDRLTPEITLPAFLIKSWRFIYSGFSGGSAKVFTFGVFC